MMSPPPRPPPLCTPSRPRPFGSMALHKVQLSIVKKSTTPWYVGRVCGKTRVSILKIYFSVQLYQSEQRALYLTLSLQPKSPSFFNLSTCVCTYTITTIFPCSKPKHLREHCRQTEKNFTKLAFSVIFFSSPFCQHVNAPETKFFSFFVPPTVHKETPVFLLPCS